jgi:transposase-like protein
VFSIWRWTEIDGTLNLVLIAPRSQECRLTFIAVRCPHCQSEQSVKRGKTGCGTQQYLCQNTTCTTGSFLLDYRYLGRLPEVKHQIIDMSLNASGVRDTARVLRIAADQYGHRVT